MPNNLTRTLLAAGMSIALGTCAGPPSPTPPQLATREIVVFTLPWVNGTSVVCILAVYPDGSRSGMCRVAGNVGGGRWG